MRALLLLIILANIIGTLFGFYYYSDQLYATPLLLWVFVPDCPLYTLLFVARFIKTNRVFDFVVAVGLFKYACWTLFVLLFHSSLYFAPQYAVMSSILLILHTGMALEAFLIVPLKPDVKMVAASLAWFLLNDLFDYGIGTHPLIPMDNFWVVIAFTFAMTFVSTALLYKKPDLLKPIRGKIVGAAND